MIKQYDLNDSEKEIVCQAIIDIAYADNEIQGSEYQLIRELLLNYQITNDTQEYIDSYLKNPTPLEAKLEKLNSHLAKTAFLVYSIISIISDENIGKRETKAISKAIQLLDLEDDITKSANNFINSAKDFFNIINKKL